MNTMWCWDGSSKLRSDVMICWSELYVRVMDVHWYSVREGWYCALCFDDTLHYICHWSLVVQTVPMRALHFNGDKSPRKRPTITLENWIVVLFCVGSNLQCHSAWFACFLNIFQHIDVVILDSAKIDCDSWVLFYAELYYSAFANRFCSSAASVL